jgi:exopolysaccharide production protein ExoZ
MRPGERLAALEGLRGYAAFLVFLVHAFGVLSMRIYGLDPDGHDIASDPNLARAAIVFLYRSHYGVDLFFVLSGLLMADLALRRWPGTGPFLERRWLRIYPAYAVSSIIVAAALALLSGRQFSAREAWANVFVLQGFFPLGIAAVNPVSWSLTFEVAFYLVVPLLAARWAGSGTGERPAVLATAFVAIVAAAWLAPIPNGTSLAYFALFIPGIALGQMGEADRERLAARMPLALVVIAWIGFTIAYKFGALAYLGPAASACFAIATGLLVLKACDSRGSFADALSGPVPRWLGKYSYSFFLIHYIVVHLWGEALARMVSVESRLAYGSLFLAGSLALSLAGASLLFETSERFYFRRR